MMMTKISQQILAGVIFLAAIVTALLYSYRADSYSADNLEGIALHARFSDIGGLQNGARVLLAGVDVGKVVSREFNPQNFSIEVIMDINTNVALPLDSSITIVSDGIFGGKYIALSPGAEYDALESGDAFEYVNNAVDVLGIMEAVILSAEKKVNQ